MRSGGLSILLMLLVALLLRSTALSVLGARGVVIDVLAFATVAWSLRYGETSGTLLGFTIGLLADLDDGHWLGRHALVLALLGYAIGRLSHTLVRERTRTHLVVLAIATAVHQTWCTAFDLTGVAGWPYLLQRVALSVAVTAPLGALLIALARRLYGRPLFPHGPLGAGTTG